MQELDAYAQIKVKDFLEHLEDELKKQNLTVEEFAEKIGVTKDSVYKWLRGDRIMNIEKFFKAIKVLGLEDKYKLEGKEWR